MESLAFPVKSYSATNSFVTGGLPGLDGVANMIENSANAGRRNGDNSLCPAPMNMGGIVEIFQNAPIIGVELGFWYKASGIYPMGAEKRQILPEDYSNMDAPNS